MTRRLLNEERGYSLVEVMASIMILAIAIIPMVGMFDMGLNAATRGSNYDKARALANLKLEEAKSLPFDSTSDTTQDVKDNFPEGAGTTTTYSGSGYYQSAWMTEPGVDFANFEYRIGKQYMTQPSVNPASSSESFTTSSAETNLIRVTVMVRWGNGSIYTTSGLVAR